MARATTTVIREPLSPIDVEAQTLQQLGSMLATHADGITSFVKLVDALHQANLLEMATALLRRGGNILDIVVEQAVKPEAVVAVKNLFALMSTFSTVDLSQMTGLATSASHALKTDNTPKVQGMWGLLRAMRDPDVQAGLSVGLVLLKVLGQAQHHGEEPVDKLEQ